MLKEVRYGKPVTLDDRTEDGLLWSAVFICSSAHLVVKLLATFKNSFTHYCVIEVNSHTLKVFFANMASGEVP